MLCIDGGVPVGDPPPDGVRLLRPSVTRRGRSARLLAWARSDIPRIMLGRTVDEAHSRARPWLADAYDLQYLSHLDSWYLSGSLVDAPAIVDLDNLENLATRASRRLRPAVPDVRLWAKWLGRQPFDLVDERRFERTQLRCARDVATVTLCSHLDVERSGMSNAVAIPNGYELAWPARQDRAASVGDPATVLFVGNMFYGPNLDAARWFAAEILPALRQLHGEVSFRVVGVGGHEFRDLRGIDGVVVTGPVDDLRDEIDRADLAVVPIRFGAGTRLKVVEALANRLPLVTTTIGSEGIEVVDGQHALIADDAATFAAACARALDDAELRSRLIAEGERLFDSTYRWELIRAELAALACQVAGL